MAVVILKELELFVMEGFGIGVAPCCFAAQHSDIDGKRFIIMFHELSEIEKLTKQVGRHVLRSNCVLNIGDQLLLDLY